MSNKEMLNWFDDNYEILVITGFPYTKNGLGESPPYHDKLVKSLLKQCKFLNYNKKLEVLPVELNLRYFKKGMNSKEFKEADTLSIILNENKIFLKASNSKDIFYCENKELSSDLKAFYIDSIAVPIVNSKPSDIVKDKFLHGYEGTKHLNSTESNNAWEKIKDKPWCLLQGNDIDKALMDIASSEEGTLLYGEEKESDNPTYIHLLKNYCLIKIPNTIYVYSISSSSNI